MSMKWTTDLPPRRMEQHDYDILLQQRAEAEGLALPPGKRKPGHFILDLNSGKLFVPDDPKTILQLVHLAMDLAEAPWFSVHERMLRLVALKEELASTTDNHVVTWHRRYTDRIRDRPKECISLEDWLEANDHSFQASILALLAA